MTTINVTPRHVDSDDDEHQQDAATAPPLDIALVFQGIAVTAETAVTAHIERPAVTTVADLTSALADWAVQQQQQNQNTSNNNNNNNSSIRATISLNWGGKKLSDAKSTIHFLYQRNNFHSLRSLPKMYVSGSFGSASDSNHSATSTAGIGAAMREARRGGNASDYPNMPPDVAERLAEQMANNPAMMQMIINSNPEMKEALERDPQLRAQFQDPEFLKNMMMSQLSGRHGRAAHDTAMSASLSHVLNHPEGGQSLIESALGRAGLLDGASGGRSIDEEVRSDNAGGGGGEQQQEENSLLPMTANNSNSSSQSDPMMSVLQSLLGGGGGGGGAGVITAGGGAASSSSSQTQQPQRRQRQQQQQTQNPAAAVRRLAAELIDMGFEPDMADLAASEAEGDLEKALALIEEWQE